jgi:phosphate transport system substrate-binding protein
MIVSKPNSGIPVAPILGFAALLGLLGTGVWFWETRPKPQISAAQTDTAQTAPVTPIHAADAKVTPPPVSAPVAVNQCQRLSSYLARLSGSNTIGGELAPNLAEAWLVSKGATNIAKQQCVDDSGHDLPEFVVRGQLNGAPAGVEINAHGTGTGVAALAKGTTDIWMASAQATDAQLSTLSPVGVQRGGDTENVVGLDGVAVILSPTNPVSALSKAQVKAIFTGQITDWSALGGTPGPIHLFARDKESGTRKTFAEMVLGSGSAMAPLVAQQPQGYDNNADLSHDVAADPQGIGFVGMGYVKPAKAIAIGDGSITPVTPSNFTVQKEIYPLTRRLYLYTSNATGKDALEFVRFALGDGQKHFNSNTATSLKPDVYWPPRETSACELSKDWHADRQEFCRLRSRNGEISSSFAFETASSKLDNLARANLARLTEILHRMPDATVVLAGFADSRGARASKCALSQKRAESVAAELSKFGVSNIKSRGFCDELPIRDDLGEDFERNRRVDVFVSRVDGK